MTLSLKMPFAHFAKVVRGTNFPSILSIDQLNQLYSKLQDAGRLGTETDIRDLASNLTGKYDGKRQSKAVDWKGNKTDLAILIGSSWINVAHETRGLVQKDCLQLMVRTLSGKP